MDSFRLRHYNPPFLLNLRHLPCAVCIVQVESRIPAFNHGGIANVKLVRRLLIHKQTQNNMAAMPDTTLWYKEVCIACFDKALSVTALLQHCPKYKNFATQEVHSLFSPLVPTVLCNWPSAERST